MSSSPQPVDGPRRERSHSGRLLLRMPETLHAELAAAADRAGVSLNQFITSALAETVGRRELPARQGAPKRERAVRAPSRSRWLTVLLAVNLLVVAAAGVLAILLLLSSWRG
ncbi:MAG TPA: toxin-antitoxin system HicB family antitoxin [Gaiellaceae bacterium]|nr:toxin-antitoxin system HicB family antitoxin [Gaiellaceae bacterium]